MIQDRYRAKNDRFLMLTAMLLLCENPVFATELAKRFHNFQTAAQTDAKWSDEPSFVREY
jgi:hypothetical protein